MPAVFVHGVPDTYKMWEPIIKRLNRTDSVCLALPGFGAPVPKGFGSTKDEYVDWIIGEIEKIGGKVDLVGHDWGCMLTARVASLRPELIRTWAGGDGPVSAKYSWHPDAVIWQTTGRGEKFMADTNAAFWEKDMVFHGKPAALSATDSKHVDAVMKDSILKLYRSAVSVGEEWEPGLKNFTSPALAIWGRQDGPVPHTWADDLADNIGANVVKLNGKHWALLSQPDLYVRILESHWGSV